MKCEVCKICHKEPLIESGSFMGCGHCAGYYYPHAAVKCSNCRIEVHDNEHRQVEYEEEALAVSRAVYNAIERWNLIMRAPKPKKEDTNA